MRAGVWVCPSVLGCRPCACDVDHVGIVTWVIGVGQVCVCRIGVWASVPTDRQGEHMTVLTMADRRDRRNVVDVFSIQYPLEGGSGDGWTVEIFDTEGEAAAAAARVMNETGAEYVVLQEKRGGVWREPYGTFTREAWEAFSAENAD